MEREGDTTFSDTTFIESQQKQAFRFQVPWGLRFSLIWTIFFSAVGLFIQYTKDGVSFIWTDFFAGNYIDWFISFGNFTDPIFYNSADAAIISILSSWYYFFYTGGLLALIWNLLAWIIHGEIIVKKPQAKSEPNIIIKEVEKPVFINRAHKEEMEEWLDEGWLLLTEGKVKEAQALYNQIRRYYDPSKDSQELIYKGILDFYQAILETKNK